MLRQGAQSPDGGDEVGNSLHDDTLSDFYKHLREAGPLSFWLEVDPLWRSARLPNKVLAYEAFASGVSDLGYDIGSFVVPHNLWIQDVPRHSLIVFGFHKKDGGGTQAVHWFKNAMQPMLGSLQAEGPPLKLWNTVKYGVPNGVLEPVLDDGQPGDSEMAHRLMIGRAGLLINR